MANLSQESAHFAAPPLHTHSLSVSTVTIYRDKVISHSTHTCSLCCADTAPRAHCTTPPLQQTRDHTSATQTHSPTEARATFSRTSHLTWRIKGRNKLGVGNSGSPQRVHLTCTNATWQCPIHQTRSGAPLRVRLVKGLVRSANLDTNRR